MINSDWKLLKVRDFAEVVGGGTPSTKNVEYWGKDIPWISPKDLSNYYFKYISKGQKSITKLGLSNSSAKLLPSNSLLFSSRAPIGYLAINTCPVATNQGFKSLIPKKGFDIEYLYYLFKKNIEYIKSQSTGSTFQEVSGSFVKDLEFFIPSYKKQLQISRVLSTLDKKIEINQKMNKNLEEIAGLIFKSWFVDFDPVAAKVEGRSTGLSKEISDLFPDIFEATEFGKIPKGWKIGKLETIASKINEKFKKSEDWSKEKLIDLGRMPSRSIVFNSHGLGNELSTSVCRFRKNDFLFGSIRPYFYKAGICPFDGVTNTSVFVLRSIKDFDREYLYCHSSSNSVFKKSVQYSQGTKMPIISWNDFKNFDLVLANKVIRKSFSTITRPLFEKIIQNIFEEKILIELRDTLLPKLISGKLKIIDAKKIIDEATA